MENKILIELIVPELDESYDMYIPVTKKIGNIIELLNKALEDMTNGIFIPTNRKFLYNRSTGVRYEVNVLVKKTDIRNGTRLVFI